MGRRDDWLRVLILGALPLATTGCATINHGRWQAVEVRSRPSGALATAGDQTVTTPGELRLARESPAEITIHKEGCSSVVVKLRRRLVGSFWFGPAVVVGGGVTAGTSRKGFGGLNQAVGGILVAGVGVAAMCIDIATGAAYRLDPPAVDVELECPPRGRDGPP